VEFIAVCIYLSTAGVFFSANVTQHVNPHVQWSVYELVGRAVIPRVWS